MATQTRVIPAPKLSAPLIPGLDRIEESIERKTYFPMQTLENHDFHSPSLSDREIQVIELVASGLSNEQIAVELAISKRTVDNHISNILDKTHTHNRVALVRWAMQWGKICIDGFNCCPLPKPIN